MSAVSVINETLITPKELNDAGIISLAKQFEERKAGRLKCYRIGTRVLYGQKHIDEYFALCEQGGRSNNATETTEGQ